MQNPANAMQNWVDEIKGAILQNRPELIGLFEIYAAEAMFGRALIEANLKVLSDNAKILEIGAGSLILSTQLAREGYSIVALEPVGQGFSHFNELQEIVLNLAKENGLCPEIIQIHAEHLNLSETFDFAFSINVMEHVDDVSQVINQVVNAVKMGGTYRFICPNYSFPYEPHFNIPTIYSKNITEKIFKNKIYSNAIMSDPIGTWRSINWITVNQVKKLVYNTNKQIEFKQNLLLKMIERVVEDPIFSARRPSWLKLIFKLVIMLNIHKFTRYIPASFQPVMDCSIFTVKKV